MLDWKRGGRMGSINVYARREVERHMDENPAVRGTRYSWKLRLLRWALGERTFTSFVIIYLAMCLVIVLGDVMATMLFPAIMQCLTRIQSTIIDSPLSTFGGYAIAAQTGLLGVVSIAIGLVALIAERRGAGTDIRVYYHASLAFEVVASCIALLLVLCVQLFWPVHLAIRYLGNYAVSEFSKVILLALHISWLALNLMAMAHYVAVTFRFVQQNEREGLRERYTANAVLPVEMTNRLREALYMAADNESSPGSSESEDSTPNPELHLGSINFGKTEIYRTFRRPVVLNDVCVSLVRWVVQRWHKRCLQVQKAPSIAGLKSDQPALYFPLHLDNVIKGKVAFCARRGGVPLNWFERIALAYAFRFRSIHDEG